MPASMHYVRQPLVARGQDVTVGQRSIRARMLGAPMASGLPFPREAVEALLVEHRRRRIFPVGMQEQPVRLGLAGLEQVRIEGRDRRAQLLFVLGPLDSNLHYPPHAKAAERPTGQACACPQRTIAPILLYARRRLSPSADHDEMVPFLWRYRRPDGLANALGDAGAGQGVEVQRPEGGRGVVVCDHPRVFDLFRHVASTRGCGRLTCVAPSVDPAHGSPEDVARAVEG